jgi:hypothetical protein
LPCALEQPNPDDLVRHVHRNSLSLRVKTFTSSDRRLLATGRTTSSPVSRPHRSWAAWTDHPTTVRLGQAGHFSATSWATKWVSAHGAVGIINPFSFLKISLNLVQTSKIHIYLNICPKFVKSVLLFFLMQDLSKKNIKLNRRP